VTCSELPLSSIRDAITDDDWSVIRAGYQSWLATENFDEAGVQRRSLRELIAEAQP
jgi:hypothetical protein